MNDNNQSVSVTVPIDTNTIPGYTYPQPCPSCGACPTCGRGGYYGGFWPAWPYYHPWGTWIATSQSDAQPVPYTLTTANGEFLTGMTVSTKTNSEQK